MVDKNDTESDTLSWSPGIDAMLASWCDHAKCYEWMHTESFSLYDARSKYFMIAINTLTAVSGVSNIIAGGYAVDGFQIAWIFGGISIAASTLNMLQDKLAYQTSSVIHKRLAAEWASIRTQLEEIITIPYSGRKDCRSFLKFIKTAINTAATEGSMIPKPIRDACYEKFNNIDQFDIPDICGQMEHTRVRISAQPLLSNAPMN
jgi:hypothetical protein